MKLIDAGPKPSLLVNRWIDGLDFIRYPWRRQTRDRRRHVQQGGGEHVENCYSRQGLLQRRLPPPFRAGPFITVQIPPSVPFALFPLYLDLYTLRTPD